MLVTQPPYALAPTTFRFAALAALAGRAPIGGQREVALATYVVARLAHDVIVDRGVNQAARTERAGHAKHWLSTLALPVAIRPALISSVDASAGEAAGVAKAVRSVIAATAALLDPASREELSQLAASLESADRPASQAVVK
ncbi:MAG TPA: hypothetical protein VGM67_04390 [Gemmatimonadaceae bacterium]